MMLRIASLTVLLLALIPQGEGERRSLSEIRYHFTPCGMTGRMGPSYQDCVDYYTSISSSIIRDDVLTDTYSNEFEGSQSFRVPRDTVYNVTIAGAAGGRGLCNSEYGRGLVYRTSFTPPSSSYLYLILVGQRGLGPCETGEPDPGHMLCQNPPQNSEDSTNCSESFHQWLQTLRTRDAESTLDFSGGAGGGGASFIGVVNRQSFSDVTVSAISGGGGGSSSLLNYSVIRDLLPQQESSNMSDRLLYTDHLDARPSRRDTLLSHPEGVRGYKVESNVATAGAGGGLYGSVEYPISQEDGKVISVAEDFAIGGTHCARSDLSDIPLQLREADGGFGGGGGGCGGGGGGGGYTGGSVIGDTNTSPGAGGHAFDLPYFLDNSNETSLPTGSYTYNTEDDGYVDIVAADCGCVYECVVYEEEDQFECLCPNNTQLAPDLSDCYHTVKKALTIAEYRVVDSNKIIYKGVSFDDSAFIFSASVDLVIAGSQEPISEDDRCVLVFLGGDNNIVLATNPVIGSGTATTLSEVNLNLTSGTLTMTDYTSFLNSSVLVTAAVLVSTEECEIGDMAAANVSVRMTTAEPAKLSSFQLPTSSVVSQLLQLLPVESVTSEAPTDASESRQTILIPIIISVCVLAVFLAILFIALMVVVVATRSKQQKNLALNAFNIPLEPCHLRQNAAYGVASSDEQYHLYESIPDVHREIEPLGMSSEGSAMEALIQSSTNNGQMDSSDYYVNDVQSNSGESDYYVNDP